MNRKRSAVMANITLILLPFIAGWTLIICTGFTLTREQVFTSDVLWVLSAFYWAFLMMYFFVCTHPKRG